MAMSTAYHPQTDGQTEWANQEIDLALRIYCGNNPETWSTLLPSFEFCHNQQTHSVTKKSPFELLMGYNPEAFASLHEPPTHPSVEERLRHLREARENTIAAHQQAAAAMAKRTTSQPVTFKKGDKVLL